MKNIKTKFFFHQINKYLRSLNQILGRFNTWLNSKTLSKNSSFIKKINIVSLKKKKNKKYKK